MSETRTPMKKPPAAKRAPWPVWKLGVLLYPFAAGAVAINVFMLSLAWQRLGWPALTPVQTLFLSIVLGVPATWAAGLWARHLIDVAEGRKRG
ncbi:hypothetical protein [Phaeovulum sp.]|uniref:hypothetical protein n=1 Tax=Phaeovulum sp. TaxID=2934796 RepID=UPI0039E4B30F